MVLLGDTSRPSELKPKVTLMDRMRSFKRLKPLTGASRNTVPKSSQAQEPQKPPSIHWMRKAKETSKSFHHSYVGHTEGLEPFLADVQRFMHTPNRINQKVLDFNDFGIQVEEDPWEEGAPGQPHSGRTRSSLKIMFPEDGEVPHISGGDPIQELEVTIEGSNFEGNMEGGYEESPGHLHRDKAVPFGGVVKFFSNMAEVAHKWWAISWEEPQMGRRCCCEAYPVHGREDFILKAAASQASFQLNLSCSSPEHALQGNVIGRCQHLHLKALQASITFKMSVEGEETSGQTLADPCTAAALPLSSTSAAFEFQDDQTPQNCYSCHYSSAFTGEHCFSEEFDKDTETVVTFFKEDDSAGESSLELDTCARRVTMEAVVEKLEEKLSKLEDKEASRGPTGFSQAGEPQESDLSMDAVETESEANKACTGVSSTQVRGELSF